MILSVRGLTVSAPIDGQTVEILRDIDFDIGAGRVLGLVGESGAGKSMIGHIIARTQPAGFAVSRGSLVYDGCDLAHADARTLRALLGDRITFIPQEPLSALNPLRSIGVHCDEHLARLDVPRSDRRRRSVAALSKVRLADPERLLDRYPFELSGGMSQRVLIALAFASNPALVIADEPTTALDVSTQATIANLIRRMQRDHGTALLFITHDLRLAAHVADDVMVLYAGELVERGPARRVLETPQHPYTRALKAAIPSLRGPIRRLLALPEHMPGPAQLARLPGCRFAPRCPVRDATCAGAISALREIAPRHVVRAKQACEATMPERPPVDRMTVSAAAAPLLTVHSVSKTYNGTRDWRGRLPPPVEAVKKVSLTLRPGEILGVVGESGSGKSTLARLVMGLETATQGSITLEGEDITRTSARTRSIRLAAMQLVFQDPQSALNPRRSVGSIVTQGMEAQGSRFTPEQRLARARELLAETGLPPDLLARYPSQLSGGQKQRVNIGRALCITPRIMIADEIVSGLDVSVQAQILNLLLDLRERRGIAVLFVSHDLAVVRYICSRLIVMWRGEVVESGEIEAVFASPQHPFTRELLAAAPPDDLGAPWPRP